jgi:hypothetical protein
MAYQCELENGQTIFLDNQGNQTTVTISTQSRGQQQQSSSSFNTGTWTSPPAIYQTADRAIIKIKADRGESIISLQGNSLNITTTTPPLNDSQRLSVTQVSSQTTSSFKPMQPMQPMEPMKMGEMEMNLNPMKMKMGTMEMSMGDKSPSQSPRFCSQCGSPVKSSDRFCSNCGYQLK